MSDVEKSGFAHHDSHVVPKAATVNIASPSPLGLFSFASTTFILSLYNLQSRGITHPNAVVGMAIFCGGLTQLLAGMWEFPKGNTFGATAFSSYGAFWLSFATIFWPGSGILVSYADPEERRSALGIYLITWFLVTFFFFIASLRKNVGFIALFGLLCITFILLAAGEFQDSVKLAKAGGGFGCVTAFVAYYIGLSDLLANEQAAVVRLPIGPFKHD